MAEKRAEVDSSVSKVMGSVELVSMIAERLGRRDRARCSPVSKLWAECSRHVSDNEKQLAYLLTSEADGTLCLCNANTGEEHTVTFMSPRPCRHVIVIVVIRAVCQGLVLISVGNMDFFIGEPLINQWKLLPLPRKTYHFATAGLRRLQNGGVEFFMMDLFGSVDRYEFENNCWVRQVDGFGEAGYLTMAMTYAFHYQSSYYVIFKRFPDDWSMFTELWQYDCSSCMWREVEHRHVLDNWYGVCFLDFHGRFFIYVYRPRPLDDEQVQENKAPEECHRMYELVDGKVVEVSGWLDAANALDSSWKHQEWECLLGQDEEFFWVTSSNDVIKHSKRDMSFTKLFTGRPELRHAPCFYYVPDEGEALWHFSAANRWIIPEQLKRERQSLQVE